MTRILITAAGTGTAFSYVTAIAKSFNNVRIYTADTNPAELVTAAVFSHKHFILPSISESHFSNKLEEIIRNESIDFYIPLIDQEIAGSYQSNFVKKIVVANKSGFCEKCLDKENYENSFSDFGFSFPRIFEISSIDPEKEYILKKNGGFGGRNTKIITGLHISSDDKDYKIYEKINGKEFTIDCFPIGDGSITSVRHRIEVKNGVCTKAHIIRNEQLENIATNLVKKFQLSHPFCFQVIERDNDFYLIDFNPRLGAGTAMSGINGLDFFSAHIAKLLDRNPLDYLNRLHHSCIVTRQYSNYLTKVD